MKQLEAPAITPSNRTETLDTEDEQIDLPRNTQRPESMPQTRSDRFYTSSSEFCGPSSTEFTFNAVNGNLRAMGLEPGIVEKSSTSETPQSLSSRLAQYGPFMKLLTMDPLWDVKKEDALKLIDDWCFGLGAVYPVVNRQVMIDTANKVSDALSSAQLEDLNDRAEIAAEALFNQNTNKLKIVLAIGLTREAGGRTQQAERLFQSISEAVEGLMWNPQGIHGIQLLFLMAMYHYHLFDEVRTGRGIAFAARLCLEKGLHRRAMLNKIPAANGEQSEALNAFWAVYTLERRLSLGQGIPFSIQDSHIDPGLYNVSKPEPMLSALLEWTRIAGRTWHTLNSQGEKGTAFKIDDLDYLDYQVLHWYNNLPSTLQLTGSDIAPTTPRNAHKLYYQSVMFTRKSHLRNLIYRPVLHSTTYFKSTPASFLKGVEIAQETVRTLFSLNSSTSLVQTHPLFFQQLLLTAFGNLLLAVVNASTAVWTSIRAEFDQALTLFRLLSSRCASLRRTWLRLQGLRDLPTKLNHPIVVRSDGGAMPPPLPLQTSSERQAGDEFQGLLTFDAIFPEFIDVGATVTNASQVADQAGPNEAESSAQVRRVFEDLVIPDNMFDFPFLDLESSLYLT